MDEKEVLEVFKDYCPDAESIEDINDYLQGISDDLEIVEVGDYERDYWF